MMRLTKRKVLAMAIGSAMLAACSGEPSASGDVSRETLRAVGDRFDKAQIEQNRDELERLIADDFVFVGSGGVREGKREFIDGRSEEQTSELQSLMRNSYAVFGL